MFMNKQNLLKNFQHSQKIIHLFRALEGISQSDHHIKEPIEEYFKKFFYFQKDAKNINDMCFDKSKDYNIEKLLLNMISERIENDIHSKPQRVYDIIKTIDTNYNEIMRNKPINKFEYHCKQFGYA